MVFLDFVVAFGFTAVFFLVDEAVFLTADVATRLIEFGPLGVGDVVHCHVAPTSAQAWPSFAVPYVALSATTLPVKSISRACPPLFDKLRPVSAE